MDSKDPSREWIHGPILTLGSLLLAGCATNSAAPSAQAADAVKGVTAITYHQPLLEKFDLAGTYVLTKCEKQNVTVQAKVTMTPSIAVDPTSARVFDPTSIPGRWRKQLDLKVELTELGTLKAVNVGVSDRTAAIITNIVKTIGSLFGIAPIFPAAAVPPPPVCSEAAIDALAQIKVWESEMAAVLEARAKARSDINPPEPPPGAPVSTPLSDKAAAERIAALDARLKSAQDAVSALRTGVLAIEHKGAIKLTDETRDYFFQVPQDKYKAWFRNQNAIDQIENLAAAKFRNLAAKPEKAFLTSHLALTAAGKVQGLPSTTLDELIVRIPFETHYSLCNGPCLPDGKGEKHASGVAAIPQWGSVRHIDFGAAFAEDRTVGFTLDAAGRLTSLAYKRNARGEAVTGAMAGISAEALTSLKSVQFADKDAELAELKRELDYYDLKNKLKAAKDTYLQSLEPATDTTDQ